MRRCQSTRYREVVDRVLELTRSGEGKPIHVADVARAAGVSPRTLVRAFHTIYGQSPSTYLRALRLSQARLALSSMPTGADPVTQVATRFGFGELGRFAARYRRTFGESPSETIRRSSTTIDDTHGTVTIEPQFHPSKPKSAERGRAKLAICS